MPFIGQQPTQGRFIELDSLTASATANYTLQLNSANYFPESVNNLLVSINGVIQGSSTMSLNGAVLTVGATLSSSDTIDFVRVFGNVGTVSTPTDGSVTTNKIGANAVTSAKMFSGFVNGITEFDMYRITANTGNTADADITADWERVDDPTFEKIGTGISQSSGIFSFPSTGKYLIHTQANIQARNGTVTQGRLRLFATQDNSSYTLRSQTEMSGSTDHVSMVSTQILFKVTNISNDKVKLNLATSSNNIRALGDSTLNRTFISFMKIGA